MSLHEGVIINFDLVVPSCVRLTIYSVVSVCLCVVCNQVF